MAAHFGHIFPPKFMAKGCERHRHLQDCVADEGNMVSQLRENQGRFGVTSEGLTGQGGSSILGLPE